MILCPLVVVPVIEPEPRMVVVVLPSARVTSFVELSHRVRFVKRDLELTK